MEQVLHSILPERFNPGMTIITMKKLRGRLKNVTPAKIQRALLFLVAALLPLVGKTVSI